MRQGGPPSDRSSPPFSSYPWRKIVGEDPVEPFDRGARFIKDRSQRRCRAPSGFGHGTATTLGWARVRAG